MGFTQAALCGQSTIRMNIPALSSDRDLPWFFTEAIRFDQFRDIEIDGLEGGTLQGDGSAIALKDGAGVSVRNCQASKGTGIFLWHSGVTDPRAFLNNDLTRAQRVCEPPRVIPRIPDEPFC